MNVAVAAFKSCRLVAAKKFCLRQGSLRTTIPISHACRLFANDANLDNDETWKQMSEKCRSLANLLLDYDDLLLDGYSSDDDQSNGSTQQQQDHKKTRDAHIFNRRRALSQAITMIESRNAEHQRQSGLLLTYLLNHENNHVRKKKSFRLGIAGAPGAGKSTFVEAFGRFLLQESSTTNKEAEPQDDNFCNKVAVVCIDPSSALTGGSILGDKTRMTELARHKRVRQGHAHTCIARAVQYVYILIFHLGFHRRTCDPRPQRVSLEDLLLTQKMWLACAK